MKVYVTGPDNGDPGIDSVGFTLAQAGLEAHVRDLDMTPEEIYEEIMACEVIFLLWAGPDDEYPEYATELGIAIALGRPVYAARYLCSASNRFLDMPGVRTFDNAPQALEALLADHRSEDDDVELEGLGSGADPEDGADPGDVF